MLKSGTFARIASLLVERHIATQDRLQVEQTRRQADDHQDHFLAALVHELRNPLGALKNAVKVAQLSGDQPLPRDRALQVMGRQITQMEWLIEDLVDANRIARGELTLQLRRIELKPVLDLALEALVRDLATLHGGTIEAHSAGLGQGSEFILRLRAAAPSLAGQPSRQ